MKQITQNYKSGALKIEEVPVPILQKGGALVRTCYSLISAGTERSTIEMSKKSMLGKAKARPDLVKQVVTTAKKIGIKKTFELVMNRLNAPVPLGYSLSGMVEEVSDDVSGVRPGDYVACAGAKYANHAELVFVPNNLMVKVPPGVSLQEAACTTVGSIAMHGVRQANVGVGDCVGVIGLGLVGQVIVSLLKGQGCRVFGIDVNEYTTNFAKEMGADSSVLRKDPALEEKIYDSTSGYGLDAVIIAAGTDTNDPFELSSELLRDRGTLVIVGGIRMEIVKSVSSLFYMKEIDIKFSRSYGPGRYDSDYEEKGIDYPIGFVRWTEKRNMECFLELLGSKKINVGTIITHTFPFENALQAYDLIEGGAKEPYLGVLLEYRQDKKAEPGRIIVNPEKKPIAGKIGVGMIGAGNFAQANILPYLSKNPDSVLRGIATSKGMSAKNVAEKAGFAYCAGKSQEIWEDEATDVVFIATRHDSHAHYVREVLEAGKHVYVEKPLCLNEKELSEIISVYTSQGKKHAIALMVGYNRRFAPLSLELKKFVDEINMPITVIYRVNAGFLPGDNWYQDPAQGGRFIGEGCHFIDYGQFLTGSLPVRVGALGMISKDQPLFLNDNLVVNLQMENGSIVSIIYNASGDSRMPKERIEVFGQGSSAVLDDYKTLYLYRGGKKSRHKNSAQDKGHKNEITTYLYTLKTEGKAPISFESLVRTSSASFAVFESLKRKNQIEV